MKPVAVPDWLVELVAKLGPVAIEWVEGRLAGGVDELPEEYREKARKIIAPALARGQANEKAIEVEIEKAKGSL